MFHVKQKRVAFRSPAGACLLCRRLTLPLVCFFAPIPPTPFPAGRGRFFLFSYARGGAPCIPGIKSPTALTVPAASASGGGVSGWSPADLAFSLLFCPHPPCPPSRREGGRPKLFHARGSAPCIPGAEPGRHWLGRGWRPRHPLRLSLRGTGLPGGSAPCIHVAKPARRWLAGGWRPRHPLRLSPDGIGFFCRVSAFLPPIPPTPFPRGEGGDFWFILPGAGAPGTPATKPARCWLAGRLRPLHPRG